MVFGEDPVICGWLDNRWERANPMSQAMARRFSGVSQRGSWAMSDLLYHRVMALPSQHKAT